LFPHWNNLNIAPHTHTNQCDKNDKNQMWTYNGSSSTGGQIRSNSLGLCVSGPCGDVSSGCTPLSLVACNAGDKKSTMDTSK